MGSGDWFKTIISLKKPKEDRSKQEKRPSPSPSDKSNGFKWKHRSRKASNKLHNRAAVLGVPVEFVAATRIQTAFRAFMARKSLRCLKGVARLQVLTQGHSVNKQATITLSYLKSWSKIQAQIRARRLCMVTEDRIRQKKQENQQKLEAKLHELEVEWCGGSETMEEILARIHQREEAAVKRERAMAYAFSHQWRANSNQNLGQASYDFGNGNWGWSWKERWIAARPWENRVPSQAISPIKSQSRQANKVGKSPVKPVSSNGRANKSADSEKAKKSAADKAVTQETKTKVASLSPSKPAEVNKQQPLVSS
ncbi:protein IQ-DOMAIN 1 [Cinnamomum micranthum f. kanehirae]|uniref:Protein IQ-DOMAIN 1 n=1 Tax=Cinnamomum micranthum f. kanehirae TaxID=337451 RepID=A0A443PFV3_9MAGN|nr:protein IQ-DOMAIN 1 [Cinnamomum micranthum f. kanehirae]